MEAEKEIKLNIKDAVIDVMDESGKVTKRLGSVDEESGFVFVDMRSDEMYNRHNTVVGYVCRN